MLLLFRRGMPLPRSRKAVALWVPFNIAVREKVPGAKKQEALRARATKGAVALYMHDNTLEWADGGFGDGGNELLEGRDPGGKPVLDRPEDTAEIKSVQENPGDHAVAPVGPPARPGHPRHRRHPRSC